MKIKINKADGTIIELEGELAEINSVLTTLGLASNQITINTPYTSPMPFIPYYTILCEHEYPSPWLATVPPPCNKCGLIAEGLGTTYTTIAGTSSGTTLTINDFNGKQNVTTSTYIDTNSTKNKD